MHNPDQRIISKNYVLFGIVDRRNESSAVYIFDERVGHTTPYLLHYLKSTGKVPAWVKRVHVFLDKAGSTMSSCMELVELRVLDYLRVSFMIPGHTKFAPDLLFSKIAGVYHKSDVFNKADLECTVLPYAAVFVDSGRIVRTKYTNLLGIHMLHDFISIAKAPSPNGVLMKVREKCYSGALRDTPTKVMTGFSTDESCIPTVKVWFERSLTKKQKT